MWTPTGGAHHRHPHRSVGQPHPVRPLPVRGGFYPSARRASAHHLFPGSPRHDGALHRAPRGRRRHLPVLFQRQPARNRQLAGRPPLLPAGDPSPRPTCSRWWRASCGAGAHRRHPSGGRCCCASVVEARDLDRVAPRHGFAGKSMRWDEEVFGLAIRIDRFMIVAVSATSTWGRWRTRASTSSTPSTCWPTPRPPPTDFANVERRRPRILPQLDRQPRHLPRLVPAHAEGRPHRLPRPAVHRRHDGAGLPVAAAAASARRSPASPTCAACCAPSSPRTPARWPTRSAGQLPGDQQLHTATVYQKGAEVIRV